MKTILLLLFMTASLTSARAQAQDQPIGVLGDGGSWSFLNGGEFPGAAGGLGFRVVDGRPAGIVTYDFSAGGRYVAAVTKTNLKADIAEIRFRVKSARAERIAVRLRDGSGQYHQFTLAYSSPGEWQMLRQPVAGVTSAVHFQGNDDGVIEFPVVEILILINSPATGVKVGEVFFSDVRALR